MSTWSRHRAIPLIALALTVVVFACTDRRSAGVQPAGEQQLGLAVTYTPTAPDKADANPRIVLRPSMEAQAVYLHLVNQGEVPRENHKIRVEDGKTGKVLFTGVLPTIAPNKSVLIKVAGVAAPAAPKDVKDPKDPKDPKEVKGPAPWPTLTAPEFNLRVVVDDGKPKPAATFDVPVQLEDPSDFTGASAEIRKVKDKNQLRVTVKSTKPDTAAVPVALELEPALIPGLVIQKSGTFQSELTPKREKVELFTDADSFPGFGRVSVSVGGFARAFAFAGQLDTKTEEGLLEQRGTKPRIRIIMPRYHAATPSLRVPVQVDANLGLAGRDLRLEVAFDDVGNGEFVTSPILPNFREELVFAGADDAGRLLFKVGVHDWAPALKTESVFGERTVRVRLLEKGQKVALEREADLETRTRLFKTDPSNLNAVLKYEVEGENIVGLFADIVIDGSLPKVVFRLTPATIFPGGEFRPKVEIARNSEQAPVERVDFYLGDPLKDTDPLPKGAVGGIWDPKLKLWVAEKPFIAPAIDKGPLVVNARAETVVKLKGSAEPATIRVVEQPYPTIAGKIIWGSLEQPKTKVFLLDSKGKVNTDTESAKDGSYKFENVKPGDYFVYAAQPALKLSGSAKVAVPDDKNAKMKAVDIKLLTQSK